MSLQQHGESIFSGPALIRYQGKVFRAPFHSGLDEVLWDTAEAETSSDNDGPIEQVMRRLIDLIA